MIEAHLQVTTLNVQLICYPVFICNNLLSIKVIDFFVNHTSSSSCFELMYQEIHLICVTVCFLMSLHGDPAGTLHEFDSLISARTEQRFGCAQFIFDDSILLLELPLLHFHFVVGAHGPVVAACLQVFLGHLAVVVLAHLLHFLDFLLQFGYFHGVLVSYACNLPKLTVLENAVGLVKEVVNDNGQFWLCAKYALAVLFNQVEDSWWNVLVTEVVQILLIKLVELRVAHQQRMRAFTSQLGWIFSKTHEAGTAHLLGNSLIPSCFLLRFFVKRNSLSSCYRRIVQQCRLVILVTSYIDNESLLIVVLFFQELIFIFKVLKLRYNSITFSHELFTLQTESLHFFLLFEILNFQPLKLLVSCNVFNTGLKFLLLLLNCLVTCILAKAYYSFVQKFYIEVCVR